MEQVDQIRARIDERESALIVMYHPGNGPPGHNNAPAVMLKTETTPAHAVYLTPEAALHLGQILSLYGGHGVERAYKNAL